MSHHLVIVGDSRKMAEVENSSVDLVITSPPYWNLKAYGKGRQIGFSQAYSIYIEDMMQVLKECFRVLKSGRFLCINVGTAVSNDEMKHIPADVITNMCRLGFVFKKEIIWVKPKGTQGLWQRGTTQFLKKNPYPFHFNLNIMHEYILIFQKPGELQQQFDESARLSEEFIKNVSWSIWEMKVSYTKGHPAPFPEELPRRLVQLYSIKSDTVLDPFAGTGTVAKVARELGRNSISYEINSDYLSLIREKLGVDQRSLTPYDKFDFVRRDKCDDRDQNLL